MAVDHRLMIKKLQGLETIYASFAQTTRMPYVECDQETFDDQAYVFADEEEAKKWAKEYQEKHIPLTTVKVDKEQMLMYYSSLYLIGVNRLVFHNGAGLSYLPLEQVVTVKRGEGENFPARNATLQLTMLYFLQELRRPVQSSEDVERRRNLQEMEQEMMANLVRSRYIMAVDISQVEGEFDPQKPGQNIRIPYVKNQEGEIFQPLFSDMWEFQKFSKNNNSKFRLVMVPFKGLLPSLVKDAKGYILNPAGVNLVLLRERLKAMEEQAEV
ncbi:MAG: SseB family protein [Hungatella sp.]|nr:SseB family protein [Hungatella sp.]